MGVNELKKLLEQVHELNEFRMNVHDASNPTHSIWKLENIKMKDLYIKLRKKRKEHARFDIFINGQYILEKDYITKHVDNVLFIKFIKSNFTYVIESDDDIRIEGDIELV